MALFRQFLLIRILPLVALLLAAGCSEDDSNPVVPPVADIVPGVYIVNEGNFNAGNATLSFYIPDSVRIEHGVFKAATGKDLGDSGYSMTVHDGLLYIVVNNSAKIEVLDTKDRSHVRTIELGPGASPRYITFGPNNLGYISDLYANTVSVYDPAQNAVINTIPVGDNPEQIYYSQNHIYVANSGFGKGRTVTVIEISTHTVAHTLLVGDGPVAFERISGGRAAVLCQGDPGDFNDPNDDTPGMVYIIQTSSTGQAVLDSILVGDHPSSMTMDNNGNLYVNLKSSVCRVNTSNNSVIMNFISGGFYALQFDATRNRLYATDAKDFQQAGELYVYSTAGTLLHKFTAGVIPGRMAIVD